VSRPTRASRRRRAGIALGCILALLLLVPGGAAGGVSLSSSKAKRAVISYVKKKWGSSYAVHPACYKTSARRSRCFVHMVHGTSSCTKYATVTLKGRRVVVTMARPSC
jgi:hypothetical protein